MIALRDDHTHTATRFSLKSRFADAPRSAISAEVAGCTVWRSLIDELRRWFVNGEQLFDEADQPSSEIIEAAIAYAEDSRDRRKPPPSGVSPSGNGQIVFEWRRPEDTILLLEFVSADRVESTTLKNKRVVKTVSYG